MCLPIQEKIVLELLQDERLELLNFMSYLSLQALIGRIELWTVIKNVKHSTINAENGKLFYSFLSKRSESFWGTQVQGVVNLFL